MRSLLPAILLIPLLAGCASPGPDDAADNGNNGLADDADPAPRKGVVILNEMFTAAPGRPASWDLTIPAGARNVVAEIGVNVVTPSFMAEVNLSGCGSGQASWGSIGVAGGGNWKQLELCSEAGAGAQVASVYGLTAPLTGQLVLRADLPET